MNIRVYYIKKMIKMKCSKKNKKKLQIMKNDLIMMNMVKKA